MDTMRLITMSEALQRTSKIYIAGHRGLVGSAIKRRLEKDGYSNLIVRTHAELDLTDQRAVREFFSSEHPEYVFLAAARVGGILSNKTYPAEFIHDNIAIQTNVIDEAWRHEVKRLLFLGSSCIYPKECPQPIREEYLLTGPLEPTNRPYALAKIAGIEMCWAYNRQYGTQFLSVMPTNCYGPGDNYELQNSHVLPALIRKTHEAKVASTKNVSIWGTGTPRREFIYSDDLADACVFLMNLGHAEYDRLLVPSLEEATLLDAGIDPKLGRAPIVNIGCGEDLTIRELAQLTAEVIGFTGELVFDSSRPDGTPRKLLDGRLLSSLGWRAKTTLRDGLRLSYEDFLSRHDSLHIVSR